jgi:hypothetical protein
MDNLNTAGPWLNGHMSPGMAHESCGLIPLVRAGLLVGNVVLVPPPSYGDRARTSDGPPAHQQISSVHQSLF